MHIAILDLVANPGAGQRLTGTMAREIAALNPKWNVTLIASSQALGSGVFGNTSSLRQVGLVTNQSLQRWLPNHRTLNLPGSWQLNNFLREKIQKTIYNLEKQILSAVKYADLIYFPWSNFIPLPRVFEISAPMVMTVHDLLWKYYSVYNSSQEAELDSRVSAWLQRMDCVVADTRHLQTDLSKYFPKAARRVEAIHLAAAYLPKPTGDSTARLQVLNICEPFFLMVAGVWGHKNHANLLRAISKLNQDSNTHQYVFAGIHTDRVFGSSVNSCTAYATEIRNLGFELGLTPGKEIQGVGVISDADLALLYSRAEAVIVPSLIEGCSLPILEASALGKPVLCSYIPAHEEMAEYYGITPFFFDPHDPLDIERSLRDFLRAGAQEEDLRETAKHVRSRTWADIARQYVQIFESIG